MKQFILLVILLAFVIAVPKTPAQTTADAQLVSAIAKIKANGAVELAQMVLRGNATRLYGLPK
jgi:hypothetical protein